MNAKKAKQLRALSLTSAIEMVAYLPMRSQVIYMPQDFSRTGPSAIWLGQCVLDPKCARAQYRQFKREARA